LKKVVIPILLFIIVLSNSAFALSPFDIDEQKGDLTLSFVEFNPMTDFDDFGARARVLIHSSGEIGFGYEGFLLATDRSGQTEYYWTNNLFMDVFFLEVWWDMYLGFSIGYVFGEELIGTDELNAFSGALFLSGPIYTTPDGFPFLTIDANFSSHNLGDPWNYYHCVAEIGVYPLGGGLRPLGIALGASFGRMGTEESICFSLGICFGSYTITGLKH